MGWGDCTSGAIAFLGSAALCPVVLRNIRDRGLTDIPNERSSHTDPTPRGGGAALVIPVMAAALVWREPSPLRIGLVFAAVAMAIVGLIEDVRGIPIGIRFGLQLLVGAMAAPLLISGSGLGPLGAGMVALIGILWLVAFVNAFNFMDGINGISAVETLVAGLAYAWLGRGKVPLLVDGGLIAVGASAAFLPYNFPRARMFLGDVGSYLLGAWLALLAALTIRYRLGPVAAIAPVALYVTDTAVTLLRRVLCGERWREPHRTHAYQRLVQAKASHTQVTLLVGIIVVVCSVLGIMSEGRSTGAQFALGGAITAVVVAYVGISWAVSSPVSEGRALDR